MSDIGKTALKNKIDAKIYDNESQLITGAILNEVLQDAVDTLADGGNLDAESVDTANLKDEAVTKGKLEQNVSSDLDWAVASNSYYRNSQAGDVAAKVITTYKNMSLIGGGSLKVTFEQANTADDATLNIDGKGAKPLYYNGARVSSTNSWEAGETVEIYYNNYTTGIYYAKRWMVEPVSVSQNSQTGKTEIVVGEDSHFVGSATDMVAAQKIIGQSFIPITMQDGKYYNGQGEEVSDVDSIYSDDVDISSLNIKSLIIAFLATNVTTDTRYSFFYDENDNPLSVTILSNYYSDIENGIAYYIVEVSKNIAHFKLSLRKVNTLLGVYTSDKVVFAKDVKKNSNTGHIDITADNVTNSVASADEIQVLQKALGSSFIQVSLQEGGFYNSAGTFISWENMMYSGQIDISTLKTKGVIVAYKATDVSTSGSHSLLKDADGNVLVAKNDGQYAFISNGIAYQVLLSDEVAKDLYISLRKSNTFVGVWTFADYTTIAKQFPEVDSISGVKWIAGKWVSYGGVIVDDPNGLRSMTDYIPCPENATIKYVAETNHSLVAGISFWDINRNFISSFYNNATLNELATVTSPANTAYCVLTCKGESGQTEEDCTVFFDKSGISNTLDKITKSLPNTSYVATNGSDTTGNGQKSNPFATIAKALSNGASKVIIRGGVYDITTIDLSSKSGEITLMAYPNEVVKLFIGKKLVSSADTLEDGVYKYAVDADPATHWIHQFGIDDTDTNIIADARHALHSRRNYRCDCTAIGRVLTKAELLNPSDEYTHHYFYDNGYIYYTRPQQPSATNFIFAPTRTPIFNNPNNCKVHISGLHFYGGKMDIESNNFVANDCGVGCSLGSAWEIKDAIGVVLTNCEGFRADGGIKSNGTIESSGGDGFATRPTHDSDAKIGYNLCSLNLINCWSHDNNNDGYSDHYISDTKIYGGLYEYNCLGGEGAGLTPSFGSCDCIDGAVVQYNKRNGLMYAMNGAAADYCGTYGVISARNVVSKHNAVVGFYAPNANQFVELFNCVAIGENVAFGALTATSIMRLIKCTAVDCSTEYYRGPDNEGQIIVIV